MFIYKKGKPNYKTATHNIVFDGNSLVQGDGNSITQYLATKVMSNAIFTGSGMTVKSVGQNGRNWVTSLQSISSVTSLYQTGKRNILITWNSTNDIILVGKTALQATADAKAYTDYLTSIGQDWEIYNISTLARRQTHPNFPSVTLSNQELLKCDVEFEKNYKSLGFDGIISIRNPDSPFYLPSFEDGQWSKLDINTKVGETLSGNGTYIHLQDRGTDIVAQYVAQKLRSIGVR